MPTVLFLVTLFCSASHPAPNHAAPAARTFPAPVGLIMIGATADGIAIGADGASYNADGTISQTEKLFPIGKNGALAIAGAVSIQDPVSRPVREEVNVARIAAAWLETHPDATLDSANKEINDAIKGATTKYFSTRNPGRITTQYKFALIFAALIDGRPAITVTKYHLPMAKGKAMRTETFKGEINAGQLWVFGQAQVEQALMMGTKSSLAKFRAETSLKKLQSPAPELTLQDYVSGFDTVLRATESAEGKKMLPGKRAVAPPNKFATIRKDGFSWANPK